MANQYTPSRISANFWNNVRQEGDCLIFSRGLDTHGYGKLGFEGRHVLAHRFAWFLYYLEWPTQPLDHLCRTPACVHPFHLEQVTFRENTLRGQTLPAANVRKTHCKNGHPFSGKNLVIRKGKYGPVRGCRICRRTYLRRWYEKNRAPQPCSGGGSGRG